MPSNNNWVCFLCRYHKRKPKTMKAIPVCIHCKKDLYSLGYKIRVPKNNKVKEWEELQCSLYFQDIQRLEEQEKDFVLNKHKIEQEIELLIHKQKSNKEDRKRLKCLNRYLEDRL